MESLPDEAIQQIFSTLSARDLLHAICKSCGPKPHGIPLQITRCLVLPTVGFTGTCSAWRHVLQANQDWWQAWYQRRCPHFGAKIDPTHQDAVPPGGWQQRTLTRGLHMPWRFKPVTSRRLLYYGLGRQVQYSHRKCY